MANNKMTERKQLPQKEEWLFLDQHLKSQAIQKRKVLIQLILKIRIQNHMENIIMIFQFPIKKEKRKNIFLKNNLMMFYQLKRNTLNFTIILISIIFNTS